MKIKLMKKEFPLVALVLVVIGIGAGILAFNYTSQAVAVIRSDEKLRFSYDDQPDAIFLREYPAVRTPEGYDFDYYFQSVPAPTPLENLFLRDTKTKELPKSVVYKNGEKRAQDFYGYVKIGDLYYKYDFDRSAEELTGETDPRLIEKGRTAWLLSYYGPKILGMLAITAISFSLALAFAQSYKKGFTTKRNIFLIRISATAVGLALLSFFVAKALLLIGVFGTYGIGNLWTDLLVGSIIPGLLVLAAILGISHQVCEHMRKSIQMKEEIDGTV